MATKKKTKKPQAKILPEPAHHGASPQAKANAVDEEALLAIAARIRPRTSIGDAPLLELAELQHHLYLSSNLKGADVALTSAARMINLVRLALTPVVTFGRRDVQERARALLERFELDALDVVWPHESIKPPPRSANRRAVDRHLAIREIFKAIGKGEIYLFSDAKPAGALKVNGTTYKIPGDPLDPTPLMELTATMIAEYLPDVWTRAEEAHASTPDKHPPPLQRVVERLSKLVKKTNGDTVKSKLWLSHALQALGVSKTNASNWSNQFV